jgi:predicted RNA methylase
MATAYNSHGQGQYFNTDSCDDKYLDAISAKTSLLNGNGDFRSDECIELLKQADIVVTNPPFSLFRDFITLMMKYDKKIIYCS